MKFVRHNRVFLNDLWAVAYGCFMITHFLCQHCSGAIAFLCSLVDKHAVTVNYVVMW